MASTGFVSRVLHYLRGVALPFSISLSLLVLISALTAAKAWIIRPVVDTFSAAAPSTRQLLWLCAIVLGIFWLQALLNWVYYVVARIASARLVQNIRSDMFGHLMRQSLGYFSQQSSADLSTRVVNDVAVFEETAVKSVQVLLRDVLTILLLLVVMFLQQWRIALICVVVLNLVGGLLRMMTRRISAKGRRVQESLAQVARQLTEIIGGIDLVLSFGLAGLWHRRFRVTNTEHFSNQVRAEKIGASAVTWVLVISGLTIAVILWITGRSLLAGEITEGQFLSLLATLYLMQAPAGRIGQSVANIARGFAAGRRAMEILDQDSSLPEPARPRRPTHGRGILEFQGVSFSYQQAPVLEDVTFSVRPRELVVMVGDSGAGKSTVAKLSQRFYDPDRGAVLIDGIDLRELGREEIYRRVSYVPQDVYLFDESVEFNLRIGRPQATDEELAEITTVTCLTEVIERLPEGLSTVVGERGVLLSGGQRQRIALGRALLTEAEILVLDEATSALDVELERRILRNVIASRRLRTIFAITHRLALAEIADRVLVLNDGRLVEEGTAPALAAANGEYARLRRAVTARVHGE